MKEQEKVEGLIAYYGLLEWWFLAFNKDERKYIDSRYQPMGAPPHTLTRGTILELQQPVTEFLNGLNSWFRSSSDSSIAERIHGKLTELGKKQPVDKPGYYNGRHFTTYVIDVKSLKQSDKIEELEKLLIELVKATEAESLAFGSGVAPAYYHELAILYRYKKEYSKEVAILERFTEQKHALGVVPSKLLDRLNKARKLAEVTLNK